MDDDDDDINDHIQTSEITPMKGLDVDIFNAVAIAANEVCARSESAISNNPMKILRRAKTNQIKV